MIKVRFAPSPTGFLHLGSARTALVNWLYARHTGGKFLLRIEDTDQARSKKEFLDEILEDLKWLGVEWDEEELYQSTRFDAYKKEAEKVLAQGVAYKEGDAIIFKVERGRTIEVQDLIHGKITFSTDELKDQVMIKSDGSPAYNFCCVVDDVHQSITHIIRGDDHISNTPKQILFYRALGLEAPVFAHMPLMMGTDGAKLSKRHGAVAVEEYRKQGFLPEALANYLILLGWHPGEDKEILSLSEAAGIFDVKDMNDVQARFDIQKLRWLNGEYIMRKDTEELMSLLSEALSAAGMDVAYIDTARFKKLAELYKPRIKVLSEFPQSVDYFFGDDYVVDEKGRSKHLASPENRENLRDFAESLSGLKDFSAGNIEAVCRDLADKKKLKAAGIIHPTRMAISGKTAGAGLFEIMELLGREKVLERLRKAAA